MNSLFFSGQNLFSAHTSESKATFSSSSAVFRRIVSFLSFLVGFFQIELEILLYVEKTLTKTFLNLLQSNMSAVEKFYTALDLLSTFYETGKRSCLLDVCTVNCTHETIQEASRTLLTSLIDSFTLILTPLFSKEEAREKAIHIITSIQGSLILSRVTNDNTFFSNTIFNLKKSLDQMVNV